MIDDPFQIILVLAGVMSILGLTFQFCRFIAPHAKKTALAILVHLPPITRKQAFERAVKRSVPLVSLLAERQWEEYSKKTVWIPSGDGRTFWPIPPPKPGPGHLIANFLYALERLEYDPAKADWEQLQEIGSEDIELAWNQLESREGIQHPLTPFRNL